MQVLHSLLTKMQDEIARTGNCNPDDLIQATALLSDNNIDLDFREAGVSIKQIILGQNRWFPANKELRDSFISIYMPPIVRLLEHPVVKQNTTELDRAVSVSPLRRYERFFAGAEQVAILGGILTVIALATGGGPVLGAGAAVAALITLGVVNKTSQMVVLLDKEKYQNISTYHNPYVITNKTALRLKVAFENLTSKTSQPTSLDELLKATKPTKEQKLTALALINKIENLDLRHEVLKKVTGNGINGENDAWYKFFSYQRWFTAASAEKGTLKLANEALKKTEDEIKATSAKKEKSTTATVMNQLTEEAVPPVYTEQTRPAMIDRVGLFINNLLRRMPAAPTVEPVASAQSANEVSEQDSSTRIGVKLT